MLFIIAYAISDELLPTGDAVVAVLDGMPMQNHRLLQGRIIVDDPDDYATGYESRYRVHGTSMTSLVIYGDINKHDFPIQNGRPFVKGHYNMKFIFIFNPRRRNRGNLLVV